MERESGLIPAHAGSTVPGAAARLTAGAHPRSRGEHGLGKNLPAQHSGSSPLTRGAQLESFQRLSLHRLIPAHAGSTPP